MYHIQYLSVIWVAAFSFLELDLVPVGISIPLHKDFEAQERVFRYSMFINFDCLPTFRNVESLRGTLFFRLYRLGSFNRARLYLRIVC